MSSRMAGRSVGGRDGTMGDGRLAVRCLGKRRGAASQAELTEEEQVDFNKRNEYKYCEWRKEESSEIMFD